MQPVTRVRDLFDLPGQLRKGDLVFELAEGVARARDTAGTYVVTPALADALDQALRLVGSALRAGHSQAVFVHGSFGSGKSHFMALLSLLLDSSTEAWRLPELQPLRQRHPWVATSKGWLLQLHLHMPGAGSMESAIFGAYLDHVRQHHPGVPVPALFADEQLFAAAARMLDALGDEAFFAPMNEAGPGDAWDGPGAVWDRSRFDEAVRSTDADVRAELVDALVHTRFQAHAQDGQQFIDLDRGLAVLAQHAASLGYTGVVLFLDELIAWLAARAAHVTDVAWLHGEAHKLAALAAGQEMGQNIGHEIGHETGRSIPILSFLARQRDLAELVGRTHAGVGNARVQELLQRFESRFAVISLEDRNLPAIIEKRVLRPRNADARAQLEQAFEAVRKTAGESWQVMLGQEDAAAFRRLYPFSPALLEALVALSGALERKRTAIRLLMELLVEHLPDLDVGEVVRMGDLFDILVDVPAGGDDTAKGPMRARFDVARALYRDRCLPLIQDTHGTITAERCQRLRPAHPVRIGCSGCSERACRTDNRLIKTLILAALVPEVPALRDMTASKLVQLNPGTIQLPLPGAAISHVAQKLRTWARHLGQLQVDAQADPSVLLQLDGVALEPGLDQTQPAAADRALPRARPDLAMGAMDLSKSLDRSKDNRSEWRKQTVLRGRLYEPPADMAMPAGRVPDKPALPGHADWMQALDMASAMLGVALADSALRADNLERFDHAVTTALGRVARAASRLPALLRQRLAELGMDADVDRLRTAVSAHALCTALAGKAAVERVRVLAGYEAMTSKEAVGASLASAEQTTELLGSARIFGLFARLGGRQDASAATLLDEVAAAMRQDEVRMALAPRLRALAEQAQRLLVLPAAAAPAPERKQPMVAARVVPQPPEFGRGSKPDIALPGAVMRVPVRARGQAEVRAALERLRSQIEAALAEGDDDVMLAGELILRRGKG